MLHNFLKTLYAEELIHFDSGSAHWRWDTEKIHRRKLPDDVVLLMAEKIKALAPATKALLSLSACMGNAFSLDTLSVVSGAENEKTLEHLNEAIAEGLIIPRDMDNFRFSHDRIQQACYSLIENPEEVHLRIGRRLFKGYDSTDDVENIFDVVNNLNEALTLISDPEERLALTRLNKKAGQRAKQSTAYASAVRYLSTAVTLLPSDAWHVHYPLTFSIYCELALCLHYAGGTTDIENIFNELGSYAISREDKVKVHMIRMLHVHLGGDYRQAVEIQKEALSLLDVDIRDSDLSTLLQTELKTVSTLLGSRSIESLKQAGKMNSTRHGAIMDILMELWTSAYLDSQLELVAWASCKMTSISLKHGNNYLSSYGYMNYAFVCIALLGQYETGHRFGKTAINLAEKFDDMLIRGKVYLLFAVFINHWRAPLASSFDFSLKSFPLLVENGDWTYAGYCAEFMISDPTIWGMPCQEVYAVATRYLPFLKNSAPVVLEEFVKPACLNPLLQLLGRTKSDNTFDDDDFSEERFLRQYKDNPLALSYYYVAKLRSLYWFGYLDEALAMVDKVDFVASVAQAQAKVPEMMFYASLTLLSCHETFKGNDAVPLGLHGGGGDACNEKPLERKKVFELISRYQERMKCWAENSPDNFHHKYLLVEAERARVDLRPWDALKLYESAVTEAKSAGYINNGALAHERCADFLFLEKLDQFALYHVNEARFAYEKWGAAAKVKRLEKKYAHWVPHFPSVICSDRYNVPLYETSMSETFNGDYSTWSLDMISIVEASQTLASEINLNNLLAKMMRVVMENAGANRSLFLSEDEDGWNIKAEARAEWKEVSIPLSSSDPSQENHLPLSLINYCARKRESVVLGFASQMGSFTTDVYFKNHAMKSALGLPLMRSGRLKGILYLENDLVEEAFTEKHLKILKLLSAQIAISIENAEFYKALEAMVEHRTTQLVQLNKELETANKRLEKRSNIDGLTQIFNRRYLDKTLETEWKRHIRMQYDLSLILCDIDHFKEFNDCYGHLAGDTCLRRIADTMDKSVNRPCDIVARYGGEEFVLILPETDLEGLKSVIKIVQSNIRSLEIPHEKSGVSDHVTLSFGALHTIPQPGTQAQDGLHSADLSLYEAKMKGRNRAITTQMVTRCPHDKDGTYVQ